MTHPLLLHRNAGDADTLRRMKIRFIKRIF